MKNSKKNEELQSRREFFKKAAKATLPVVGVIVLSAIPSFVKAGKTPMGCEGMSCAGSCSCQCPGSCHGTCSGSCSCSSTK